MIPNHRKTGTDGKEKPRRTKGTLQEVEPLKTRNSQFSTLRKRPILENKRETF